MDLGSAVAGGVEAETTAVAAVAMLLLWCVLLRVPKRRLGLQRKRLDRNHCLHSSAKKKENLPQRLCALDQIRRHIELVQMIIPTATVARLHLVGIVEAVKRRL